MGSWWVVGMLSCAGKLQDAHVCTACAGPNGATYQFDHLLFLEALQLPAEAADPKKAYGGYMHILESWLKNLLGEPVIGKAAPASNSHGWRVRFPGLWTTSSLLLPFLWWAKPHPSSQKSRGPRCWFLELHFFSPKKW